MTLVIREPEPLEKADWLPLWESYLDFYETALSDTITNCTWERFHKTHEPVHIVAAYQDNQMVGFATYVLHRSTWATDYYCYLEDLYVDASQRGKGIARQLIEAVQHISKSLQCERLYWSTRESNALAQKLYDKLANKTDFLQYRMPL